MKLKCKDGIVRSFSKTGWNPIEGWYEAICDECGEEFDVHDTKILKPIFKAHICKSKEDIKKTAYNASKIVQNSE